MAEKIRGAASFDAIAYSVIAELAGVAGVRGTALVLCDSAGEPALWIGDGFFDRAYARAYLEGGHRDELARLRATYQCMFGDKIWIAPIVGDDVIGVLRVAVDSDAASLGDLGILAAYISVRIAMLGDPRSLGALTPRQREVAELVAHGCTNSEIANMLAISANAVKKHVSRVLEMLDVSNRTELAALTGRWRSPSGTDQVLPPTVHVVIRNSAKPNATNYRDNVA